MPDSEAVRRNREAHQRVLRAKRILVGIGLVILWAIVALPLVTK